jgi:malonate-semialdehyde dehydrogenase (acetylating)/methylmalonate-semialdehyde dehydrogenase
MLRCEKLIAAGIEQGAECSLDGRGVVVPGYERGNFVGENCTPDLNHA